MVVSVEVVKIERHFENFHLLNDESNELEKIEVMLLLEGIYRYYGFDFRDYAYSSIKRRIQHRMGIEKIPTISALQEKVLRDRHLLGKLLSDFSINVTEMFRDPSFFKFIRTDILPKFINAPLIRIWHAGCSSGEEVYSMAILLYETGLYNKTKIYATDMNENILEKAQKGQFHINRMQVYTRNYHQAGGTKEFSEYYVANNDIVTFHPFLKENIVFAHHNLATDHSFNEFHIIVCRNVLIYFNQTLQNRVQRLFYDSLCIDGYLALGNKEVITDSTLWDKYLEVNPVEKIYKKIK
ncbi:protein-glutamate O-methyltransferase CheR [Bacillus sp. P2(2020)]|uniref:Protein-glutamate O-methyltransferase CheR n=1 Tax=Calidifontibacillus erzurumensis TaxID=2741433 RepID=A0A8J8GFF7_9BACI|nr:protein-glutamate O-methyltransferase CheR [Calidifontibacillus erzurumensis]